LHLWCVGVATTILLSVPPYVRMAQIICLKEEKDEGVIRWRWKGDTDGSI
jgi:hypothetical protein